MVAYSYFCLTFTSVDFDNHFYNIYIQMNSSNEFQMVGKEGILTKSILTEKKFQLNTVDWEYQNNFHLSLLQEQTSSKLKIKNHLCEMDGRTIKKITEIIYKDKVYLIEDTYSLCIPDSQRISQPEQLPRETKDAVSTNDSDKNDTKEKSDAKKIYIFKKMKRRRLAKQGEDDHLRNTKNISKNFCKAFISYLKSQKASFFQRKLIREAIKTYNLLLQGKKYNNNLIRKIICNQTLRDIFTHFLEEEAKNWISESRINDKAVHYEAITIYLNLIKSIAMSNAASEHESSSETPNSENSSSE